MDAKAPAASAAHPDQRGAGGARSRGDLLEFRRHRAFLSEFVLDFARVLPGTPKSRIFARIVMTPPNVRGLLAALEDNVKKYEAQFGKIPTMNAAENKGIGFTT